MEFLGRHGSLTLFSSNESWAVVDESTNTVASIGSLPASHPTGYWNSMGSSPKDPSYELANAALTNLNIQVIPTSDRMHTIPKAVQTEASRALEWRSKHGRGGTPAGLHVARTLAAGGQIGVRQVRHIAQYFPRHSADTLSTGYAPKDTGYPNKGRISWGLWGGQAAQKWAFSIVERENRKHNLSLVAANGYYDHEEPEPVALQSFDKNGSEFIVRVRQDGSGIDRLYQVEANGQVYVWDDGCWDSLGHINHDIDTYDKSLDDPYDTVAKEHVPVDRETALTLAALMDTDPFSPKSLMDLEPDETELYTSAEPDIDWVEIDTLTAAGDGNYTPEERAQNASSQVRDGKGRFAETGSRVLIGGNPQNAGKITSINPRTKAAVVKMDDGKTITVPVSATQKEGDNAPATPTQTAVDTPPTESKVNVDGILAPPRKEINKAKAKLPEKMPVLGMDAVKELLAGYPARVRAYRAKGDKGVTAAALDTSRLAMVAALPDDATRAAVSSIVGSTPGAYDPADYHVTILYLGKVADLPDPQGMQAALDGIAPEMPMEAVVGGQTTFGEGTTVFLVDGKGFAELHTDVVRILGEHGVENASEHGFTAHMSVVDGPAPDFGAVGTPLTFTSVAVVFGDTEFPITAAGMPEDHTGDVADPAKSDVPALYMAIVADDDPQAVMDVVALVPASGKTTTPIAFTRKPGKWERDDEVISDLNSPTPPPVVMLDGNTLKDVLTQVDAATDTQAAPVTAAAEGGLDRNRGNAEKLRRYWLYGKGAAKIRWNTGGDWKRCVRLLAKYMGPRAKGYCALRHKEATGMWTGDKLHREMYGHTASGEPVYSDTYIASSEDIIRAAELRVLASEARNRVLTAAGTAPSVDGMEHGAPFFIKVVIPEGIESGDGRIFDRGVLTMRELPLPLLWQIKTADGHTGSVVIGKIVSMERTEDGIGNARGFFDTGEYGKEAERLVRNGFMRGISADLDKFEADAEVEDGEENDNGEPQKIETGRITVKKGRVMAATLVAKPAFEECEITLDDNNSQQEDDVVPDGVYVEDVDAMEASALVACGIVAGVIPATPPAEWFDNPRLKNATPLTVGDDGRVYGHVAAWHVDHIGMNFGTRPPRSRSKYAYFHTGVVRTMEGEDVPVGQLTLAGGHASLEASAQEAVRHYDDTASAIADVHAGEDSYGIWVAGALRPGTTPEQIRALRASAPSGDWRPIKGHLELVAVLQVNVPGFPIARARVASGQVMALVAAGASTLARMKSDPIADITSRMERLERDQQAPILAAAAQDAESRISATRAEVLAKRHQELTARMRQSTPTTDPS